VKPSKIIFVAVLLLLSASLLKSKTLTVLLLANASTQTMLPDREAAKRLAACPGGEFFMGFRKSPNHDDAAKVLLWWAEPSTTKSYLESLGGSLLSPMKDLPVNYGKYTDYLKPMLDDLAVTPQWVAEDLARPELNLLQNDLLDELILYSTGRMPLEDTISRMDKLGASFLEANQPVSK